MTHVTASLVPLLSGSNWGSSVSAIKDAKYSEVRVAIPPLFYLP